MKLTTKGQYAIQAMIDIAIHSVKSKAPISLKEIAKNQNIPLPFLEQIAIKLRRAGLLNSTKGPHGGYVLTKNKNQISLVDIIQAVEGPVNIAPNVKNAHEGSEVTYQLWQKLNRSIYTALKSITLEDLYYDSVSFKAARESEYVQ